jgi:hypothetical protein
MISGGELEERVYESEHIHQVLAEIERNFPDYFKSFAERPVGPAFDVHIEGYEKEREAYREYMNLRALDEFEYDPGAFKAHTRKRCPIIRNCLWAQTEEMKQYKIDFNRATGRELLDTVRSIAEFGVSYVKDFDDEQHENAAHYGELGLEPLKENQYYCRGVIGYGIQSSLLYGLYVRNFAHRSQNAVWSLYFLSGRKDFGLADGSEFLMVQPSHGTCEQNYFYPPELFGFYALWIYLLLESACSDSGVTFHDRYRYVYLSRFFNHVANEHRDDINTYRWSSEYVEARPWL